MMIKLWTRDTTLDGREVWRLVPTRSETPVPVGAWKIFNKRFTDWRLAGGAYPLDPLDVYQTCCAYMIRTAERLARGLIKLETSTPEAYIARGGLLMLKHCACRDIARSRADYRALTSTCRVNTGLGNANSIDGNDGAGSVVETPASSYGPRHTLNIQAHAENLAAATDLDAQIRRDKARRTIEETLPRCARETERALRAWLAADGNMSEAARLIGMPTRTYCWRFCNVWRRDFKEHCAWTR